MDLLSLPEEMMVNIARYTEYATLRQIRKINKRIDSVTRRANCNRVPVDSMSTFNDETSITLSVATFGPEKRYLRVNLEECLPKIKILQNLRIDDVNFDEQMLATIRKNSKSFRQVSSLSLSTISCSLSHNMVRSLFFEVFPRVAELRMNIGLSEAFCNLEVLGNRQWKYLSIELLDLVGLGDRIPRLKEIIFEIAPNCDELSLQAEKTFTIKDTVNLLKISILERGAYNQGITISDVMPGEITDNIDTVKQLFESNIDGIRNVVQDIHSYEVEFENSVEESKFVIYMEG